MARLRDARAIVGTALCVVSALAACNSPSGGGPGLEPPGGGQSMGPGFGAGGSGMTPTASEGAGTGAGLPNVPGMMEPGGGSEPAPPAAPDGGVTASDAGPLVDGGAGTQDAGARDAGAGGVSCDPRVPTCGRSDPVCPDGQVPEVVSNCFGPCVPIDACTCDGPDACPDPNHYTCHMFKMRCGPYL